MSKQYCKLIMVTSDNNNKYYEMTWEGGSNFNVKYGRVESTSQTTSYPYNKWGTKYNEKIKKGYKDITNLVRVQVQETKKDDKVFVSIKDKLVDNFLNLMKKYTDNLVTKTYSVRAEAVSENQVNEAQSIINHLNKMDKKIINRVNDKLVELYSTIPRKMGNVRDYLLPNINLDRLLIQEQDNLDAMASQVSMYKPKTIKDKKVSEKKTKTLLDELGIISMEECKKVPKELEYLTKQSHGKRIEAIFQLNKSEEDEVFNDWLKKQKNTTTSILIHGTRCTSVIPILEIGLKIRPVGNYQFSGKVYGDGNYFSEHMQKSLNYTGYDNDKIILVYEVHTGNPFTYNGWYTGNSFSLNYNELQKRGYDSTYVKAGNGLLNSEVIVYKEQQAKIKYIIWLK